MQYFGFIIGALIVLLVWYGLQVLGYWKLFAKAGINSKKSLIPFYNLYIQYKISWHVAWFWAMIVLTVISTVLPYISESLDSVSQLFEMAIMFISIYASYRLAKAFGHGIWFTIGLICFGSIFKMIMGFGKSVYYGPLGNEEKKQRTRTSLFPWVKNEDENTP